MDSDQDIIYHCCHKCKGLFESSTALAAHKKLCDGKDTTAAGLVATLTTPKRQTRLSNKKSPGESVLKTRQQRTGRSKLKEMNDKESEQHVELQVEEAGDGSKSDAVSIVIVETTMGSPEKTPAMEDIHIEIEDANKSTENTGQKSPTSAIKKVIKKAALIKETSRKQLSVSTKTCDSQMQNNEESMLIKTEPATDGLIGLGSSGKYGLRRKAYIPVTKRYGMLRVGLADDVDQDGTQEADIIVEREATVEGEDIVEEDNEFIPDEELAPDDDDEMDNNDITDDKIATEEDQLLKFNCYICPYKTDVETRYKRHIKGHADLACEKCNYKTMLHRRFRDHIKKTKHANPNYTPWDENNEEDDGDFKCTLCPFETNKKALFEHHEKAHGDFSCEQCSYKTNLQHRFNLHMQKHSNPNPDNVDVNDDENDTVTNDTVTNDTVTNADGADVPQDIVKKSGTKGKKRKRNIRKDKTYEPPNHLKGEYSGGAYSSINKCDVCPFTNTNKNEFKEHRRIHAYVDEGIEMIDEKTGENRLAMTFMDDNQSVMCCVCNRFTTKYLQSIKQHIKSHGGMYLKCELCNFACPNASVMEAHMANHDNGGILPPSSKEKQAGELDVSKYRIQRDDGLTVLKCSFCLYTTFNTGHFRRHMKSHDALKCPYCDYETGLKRKYKIHMARHTRPYLCEICEYRASNTRDLSQHIMVHKGVNPYNCDQCTYQCRTQNQLYQHKRKHTGEHLTCNREGCNFKTHYKWALVCHQNRHDATNNYLCGECGYHTNDRGSFLKHSSRHFDTRDMKCPMCDYHARFKHDIAKHIKAVHQKKKAYACDKCMFKTAYRESMLMHLQAHAGIKPFRCSECNYRSADKHKVKRHIIRHHNTDGVNIMDESLMYEGIKIDIKKYKIPDVEETTIEIADEVLGTYRCTECNSYCRTQRALRHHYLMFHDQGSLSVVAVDGEDVEPAPSTVVEVVTSAIETTAQHPEESIPQTAINIPETLNPGSSAQQSVNIIQLLKGTTKTINVQATETVVQDIIHPPRGVSLLKNPQRKEAGELAKSLPSQEDLEQTVENVIFVTEGSDDITEYTVTVNSDVQAGVNDAAATSIAAT